MSESNLLDTLLATFNGKQGISNCLVIWPALSPELITLGGCPRIDCPTGNCSCVALAPASMQSAATATNSLKWCTSVVWCYRLTDTDHDVLKLTYNNSTL